MASTKQNDDVTMQIKRCTKACIIELYSALFRVLCYKATLSTIHVKENLLHVSTLFDISLKVAITFAKISYTYMLSLHIIICEIIITVLTRFDTCNSLTVKRLLFTPMSKNNCIELLRGCTLILSSFFLISIS